ncbi:CdaR family transcriptional regulator [Arthrobacter halodurans]|uniref:CdaR family transcriptional regulator n=1 Tax=Arthrobacter halodurans TaxID=516699 RepID=A0ABV4UQ94_9MICC
MSAPLSRGLAQRVVDQVSPALAHNINVMDRAGIVIASRDPARIGTLHRGAREAAATGVPAVIHAGEEPAGARPGVNLPLTLDGDIVGVVGLTGDPATVLPVAQILVLTIGLLLTRERELDASARREARDRDLLSRLVNSDLDARAVGASLAGDAPRLAAPWRLAAVVDAPSPASAESRLPRNLLDITRRLESTGRFRWASFQGALWVLGRATEHDDDALAAAGMAAAAASGTTSNASATLLVRGDACPDIETLGGSAKTLGALLARPRFLPTGSPVLRSGELTAELAVACMPAETARHLASHVSGLSAVHRATVNAYLDSGRSISETARALFAHRNTVIQRLDRIAETTGLDPRDPRQSLTLRLGLVAARGWAT